MSGSAARRALAPALAAVALAGAVAIVVTEPEAPVAMAALALLQAVLLWRWPSAWLITLPVAAAAWPTLGWPGARGLDGFDALVLVTAAAALGRPADAPAALSGPKSAPVPRSRRAVRAAVLLVLALAGAALLHAGAPTTAVLDGLVSGVPFDAPGASGWTLAKALLTIAVGIALLHDQWRRDPYRTPQLLLVGLAVAGVPAALQALLDARHAVDAAAALAAAHAVGTIGPLPWLLLAAPAATVVACTARHPLVRRAGAALAAGLVVSLAATGSAAGLPGGFAWLACAGAALLAWALLPAGSGAQVARPSGAGAARLALLLLPALALMTAQAGAPGAVLGLAMAMGGLAALLVVPPGLAPTRRAAPRGGRVFGLLLGTGAALGVDLLVTGGLGAPGPVADATAAATPWIAGGALLLLVLAGVRPTRPSALLALAGVVALAVQAVVQMRALAGASAALAAALAAALCIGVVMFGARRTAPDPRPAPADRLRLAPLFAVLLLAACAAGVAGLRSPLEPTGTAWPAHAGIHLGAERGSADRWLALDPSSAPGPTRLVQRVQVARADAALRLRLLARPARATTVPAPGADVAQGRAPAAVARSRATIQVSLCPGIATPALLCAQAALPIPDAPDPAAWRPLELALPLPAGFTAESGGAVLVLNAPAPGLPAIEIDELRLLDAADADRLRNGDFAQGLRHWRRLDATACAAADGPTRCRDAPGRLLDGLGPLGAALGLVLVAMLAGPLLAATWRGQASAAALLAGTLAVALCVAASGWPIDARLFWVLLLPAGLGWPVAARRGAVDPEPEQVPEQHAAARIDALAAPIAGPTTAAASV